MVKKNCILVERTVIEFLKLYRKQDFLNLRGSFRKELKNVES